ncbi:MAG TPA: hypothetical protein DCG69_00515 [Bacteroidales bacterium]|nr:hypothetical protein [Bacteroidales bacterium]
MNKIENKSIFTRTFYYILTVLAFVLALIALIMSVLGLGMIAFVPGGIAIVFAIAVRFIFKSNSRFNKIITFLAVVSVLFAGLRTLFFESKVAENAEIKTENVVSETEIEDALNEAFGDLEFGDIEEVDTKPIQSGEKIYAAHCARCHQPDGNGIPDKFPPLAKSDYLENRLASIAVVANGLSGENVINDKVYQAEMPKADLNNREIVAVVNYIFGSWGNKIRPTNLAEVKKIKSVSQ